jgi:CRP-like cAMP-binding protein
MATAIRDRTAQMFPRLTPVQIKRISTLGHRRDVHAGDVLFEVGDQNTPFFVVVSGTVDVVRAIGDREEPVTVLHPGEFSGEMNMLSAPAQPGARACDQRRRAATPPSVPDGDQHPRRVLYRRRALHQRQARGLRGR